MDNGKEEEMQKEEKEEEKESQIINPKSKSVKKIEFEYRERLNKFALVIRVPDIISDTLQIQFDKTFVSIAFETHLHSYAQRIIRCHRNIDPNRCSFDLNRRNLCVMIAKDSTAQEMWHRLEKEDDGEEEEEEENEPAVHEVEEVEAKPRPRPERVKVTTPPQPPVTSSSLPSVGSVNTTNPTQSQTQMLRQLLDNDPQMYLID